VPARGLSATRVLIKVQVDAEDPVVVLVVVVVLVLAAASEPVPDEGVVLVSADFVAESAAPSGFESDFAAPAFPLSSDFAAGFVPLCLKSVAYQPEPFN